MYNKIKSTLYDKYNIDTLYLLHEIYFCDRHMRSISKIYPAQEMLSSRV